MTNSNLNTHYFHSLASKRKKTNSIWIIRDGNNTVLTKQKEIQSEAMRYFSEQYRAQAETNIVNQLEFVNLFPVMISEPANTSLDRSMCTEELNG